MKKGLNIKLIIGIIACLFSLKAQAATPYNVGEVYSALDYVWITISAALILLMQIGFLLLEAGTVRTKNSISSAQKNLSGFILSTTVFFFIGIEIMFGNTADGWFGWRETLLGWGLESDWANFFFIIQFMYCGIAVTIASGALAERVRLGAYLFLAAVVAGLIYPMYGRWVWGNNWGGDGLPWLASMGFADFAGGSVIHATGGWIALGALLVIGARSDKYGAHGVVNRMPGHSAVLSAAGTWLLWIGWIGFNSATFMRATEGIGHVAINTVLAGSWGGLTAMFLGRLRDGYFMPRRTINGILGGLVAITASCWMVKSVDTILIGIGAAFVVQFGDELLEKRLKIDDVAGAIPVHAFCGVYGCLMLAAFGDLNKLPLDNRWDQLKIQAFGSFICCIWGVGVTWLTLKLFNLVIHLRVSYDEEKMGLNVAEHQSALGMAMVQEKMQEVVTGKDVEVKKIPIEVGDEGEDIARMFNMYVDERKEYEDQLKEEMAKSEEANKAKSEFLANMSHELRTPMNGVLGMATILKDSLYDKEQKGHASLIMSSAKRLLHIINNILDISKIEAGAIVLEHRPFDVKVEIDNIQSNLKTLAEDKDIKFYVDHSAISKPHVVGDPVRFGQVLINLVGNAIKFTSEGSVTVIATPKSEEFDGKQKLIFSVEDTGEGIAEDKIDTIFEKFTQEDASTTRRFGGTGLGLAVSKHLVDLMGGEIGIESEKGKGSRFWFEMTFELCLDEGAHEKVPASEAEEIKKLVWPQTVRPGEGVRAEAAQILLVEDDPTNQHVATKFLEKLEINHLIIAENGQEAADKYREHYEDIDLVLMDCQMPIRDGYEATQDIRDFEQTLSVEHRIPIIALTASAMLGDQEKCIQAGMDGYIKKPVDFDDLKSTLSRWIEFGPEPGALNDDSEEELDADVLDVERLKMITGQDSEEMLQLLELFERNTNRAIDGLTESTGEDALDNWKALTHKIKGSSGTVGANRLSRVLEQAESDFKAGTDEKEDYIELIIAEFNSVRNCINRIKA